MGCVNRSSKEFKNLAQDNNVDVNALELITHKYWIEKGSEDSFPSNVYIQEQLGNVQYKEPGANVRKLWKEKYSTAKEFSSIEELQAAKEKALKFFPESAIVHYKDSKGNYILTVKQPVEKIKYVAAKPISEELANARTLDLGLDNTETYSIGKVRELFDKFNTDKESKKLADKVFDLAESLGLKFIFDESLPINTLGRYGSSGVIKYRKSFFERDMFGDKKAPILLHEVIHAVSMYALSNKVKEEELPKALQDFRKEISKIYNEIKDNASLKGERGILDEKEMVAELSSPVFREKLKKIERDKESFWTKIVNIFKSLFGIRVNNPSSRLMKALENAMSAFDNDLYLRYSGALGVLREGQRENEWQFREMTAEEMRKAIKDHYIKKYYNNKLAERTKIRLKYARKRAFSESKEYSYLPYGRTDLEIPKKVAELRKREFLDDYGDLVQIAITTNDDEKDPDKPKKQPELVGYSFFVKFKTPKQLLDDQNRNLLNWLKILDDMSAADLQGYFAKMEQEYADYEMLHPEAKKKGSEYELQLAMESNSQKGAHPFTFNDGTQILAPFKLNDEQAAAINALDDFVRSNETSITLSGYAGTGKTSIMELFAKKMRQDWKPVAFTASTNKAAIVLKNRVEKAGFRATTLNKAFGIAVEPNDKVDYDAKNLVTKLRRADIDYGTVVVIDEASMISDDNYDILNRIAAEKGLKLIYVGDPKQLAPPKQNNISKVFRNGNGKVLGLTKVERTGQNPILREATDIRNGKPLSGISDFTEDGKGVAYMKPTDNASIDDVIKYYVQGLKDNPDFFRILAFRNKTVADYNNRVRRTLGYRGFIPNVGEPILGYANWGFIPETGDYRFVNSESYKVTRVAPERTKLFSVNGNKYELKVNALSIEDSQGRTDQIDYVDIKGNEQNRAIATELAKVKDALWAEWRRTPKTKANKEKLQRIKDDINYIEQGLFVNDNIMMGKRTLQSKVVDFGYAMTVHKSQGSTFTHVLMDDVDISVARNQSPQALDEVLLGIDDGVVPDYANSTLTETEDVDLQVNPDHTDVRQQLEYVAMSRATDTVTVISNNVKVSDSPLVQATRKKSGTQTTTQRATPTTTQQITSTTATAQKREAATPPSISTTTKTPAISNEEVWKHMSQRETPKGKRETHYTPVGQTDKRTYTVENGHIYNKEGKEVYQGESADRNKILAQLALDEDRAVRVNYRGIDYVVDNNQVITSLKTGNIMKWGKENGDRKAIIELATQRFRDYITQGKKSLATQAIDHLVTEGYDVGDEVDMQNYLANHPISSAVRAMEARKEIQEMNEIKAKAQADGTFMKAPNGKPTNLNERQWLQVRTKNFIKWFGDWMNDPANASKVVDENGEPLVVYRGVRSDSEVYRTGTFRSEVKFTTSKEVGASRYGTPIALFLNMKNPAVIDYHGEEYDKRIEDEFYVPGNGFEALDRKTKKAVELGYDGLITKNVKDGTNYPIDDYSFLGMNQAKSATDNNGMFSTENDDIQMFIGKRARVQFEQTLKKHRPDMSDAEINATLDFLHSLEDTKENTAYIKTAIKWVVEKSISLPRDNVKAKQAFDVARKKGLDIQKYRTLGELITSPEMLPTKKKKAPFNPNSAKTFSNKRTVTTDGGRVFTVYDVENTEEGQKEVCKAVAANYETSPWCLATFTATGEPTTSAIKYWRVYNSLPRKIAFENGKPVAFSSDNLDRKGTPRRMTERELEEYKDLRNKVSQYLQQRPKLTRKNKDDAENIKKQQKQFDEAHPEFVTLNSKLEDITNRIHSSIGDNVYIYDSISEQTEAWWDTEDRKPQSKLSDNIVNHNPELELMGVKDSLREILEEPIRQRAKEIVNKLNKKDFDVENAGKTFSWEAELRIEEDRIAQNVIGGLIDHGAITKKYRKGEKINIEEVISWENVEENAKKRITNSIKSSSTADQLFGYLDQEYRDPFDVPDPTENWDYEHYYNPVEDYRYEVSQEAYNNVLMLADNLNMNGTISATFSDTSNINDYINLAVSDLASEIEQRFLELPDVSRALRENPEEAPAIDPLRLMAEITEETLLQRISEMVQNAHIDDVGDAAQWEDFELPFYTTPEGEIYGFVDENGKIYLDRRVITAEHPMHEFTHLWDRMVQQKNPELWKRGIELMKQLPQWKEILEDENYGKKWVEKGMSQEQLDNYVASEVHSRLVGDQGNRLLENLGKKKGYKRIINKLKEWIKDMWKNLHKTFGNWTDEELNTLTLKDFNRMTIRDFTQAKDFKEAFEDQVSNSPVDSAKRDATVSKIESYVEWQKQHITFDKNSHKYFFDGQPIDYSVTEYGQQVFGPKNINGDHSYALAMGNAVDALTRDFFIIGEKALEKYYPNLTDERKAAIVSDLRRLKAHLDKEFHNNYKVITTEFPIAARISTPNGEKTIGGTLDMLIVDGEGNLHIFDMKAKNHAIDAEFFDKTTGQYKTVDDRRDYTFQLNGYRQILEALFPEFKNKIVDLRLIWFDTDYTRQNKGAVYTTHKESGIVTVKEDGSTTNIPLAEYDKWLTPSLKSKVEDSLLPLSRQDSLTNVRPIQENWNKGQETKPQQPQDNVNLHYENYNKRYTPRESSSIPILNEKAAGLRASGWHIEFYDKKSQDGSITNEVMTISLGQRNKGFFELVKDIDLATGLPNNDYSVHFKTKSKKGLGGDKLATVPLTDVEKEAMFKALAWAIPDGANVSTWGELSEGGVHGINRFKEFGFTQTGTRKVKHKNGGDLTIPVLTKGAVQQTSAQQQTQTRKLTSEEVYTKLKEQYPENSSERKLLDLVFPSLKIAGTKFKEVSEISADGISVVTGQYVPAENTIYYNKEHLGVNTLLHEAIHAVTSYYMQAADTSKFSKEINVAIAEIHECWNLLREDYIENVIRPKQGETVSNAAYRSWVIDDLYGLSSPTELVAEISNPELLQHIRDYDKRHKGKNIFQRLVDAIANLFGVNKSYSSLEKTLKDALVKLITSPNKELMDRYTLEAKTFKENVKKINESASVKFGVSEAWPKLYLYPQIKDESSRSYADFNLVVSDEMLRNILDIEKGVTIPISGSEIGTIITIPSSNIIMTLNGKPILSESEKTATIPLRIYNGDFFQLNTFDIKKGNNGANYITNIKPLFSTQQTNTQQQAQQQQTTLPGPETKINIYSGTGENADLSNFAARPFTSPEGLKIESVEQGFHYGKFEMLKRAISSAYTARDAAYTDIMKQINALQKDLMDIKRDDFKNDVSYGAKLKSIGNTRLKAKDSDIQYIIDNFFARTKVEGIPNWENDRTASNIMRALIKASFEQNTQALQRLLETGNATLTHTQDRSKWGTEFPKLLMEVRKELREEHPELMPGQPTVQQAQQKASVQFTESTGGYPQRTKENAEWSDVTLAFAVDFNTAGEKLTKRVAGNKYHASSIANIKGTSGINNQSYITTGFMSGKRWASVQQIKEKFPKGLKINIAGNGIYTLLPKGISQEDVNDYIEGFLYGVRQEGVIISEVRSGGQTGVDEAGIIAALRLGIPASVHAPKGYTFRDKNNKDINNEVAFKNRFNIENKTQATIKPPVAKLEKGTWSADYVYKELKKQYPEGTPMSKLVDMVFKALEETGTVFEAADLGTTRSGRFIGSENKVQYNINAIRENTILHESIHAVTSYYLKAVDPKVFSPEIQTAIEEIKECHRLLKEDFIQNHFYENGKLKDGIDLEKAFVFHTKGSVTDYGFLNPSEMVAEMSNPEFLERIRDFDRRHKGQNIFSRLINAVASLLGLRKNYTTVEDTIKKALETLITNPSKEMAEKYAEQNRNYKNNTTNLNKSNRILINNKDAIDKFFKTVPEDFSEEWIDTTLELDARNPQLYMSYDPEGRFTWEDAPVGSIMVYNSSVYFMLSDTPKTVGNKVQIKVRAISAKGLKMNDLNIKRDEVTGIDYVESAKPLFAFPVGSIADIPSSKNKPEVTQAEGNTEPASKTQKLKTVSLPGYQYYKEMTADTTVDAEWKIPLLKALDAKLNDETPLAELNDTLEKMDKILKAENEEDINKPEPEQNEKERQVLSEYERITTQINNLLKSDVISASEVRHVAELIMNSISDNITALQTTEGLAKEQFPSLNTDLDFKTASRKEIVAAVGINRLIARAKAIFEKTDYEDFEAYEQAPVIIENWEALMLLAADQFAANEGFGIVKDPTSNKFETTKDADDIGFDEFAKHNDEDAKNEEEGDEQERWQIESRTIDILRSMSELVRIGLHNCYQMEYYFDEQGQRKTRKVYSKWGIAERVNPRQAVNNILRWTQGALTLQEMVDMLKTKMEDNPWVEQLIDRLEIKEGQVNNDTDFQSQFFGVMSKHFQLYSIVLGEDGKYHSMEVNRKPALKEARNTVITQYQIGQHPLFTSNKTIKKELLGTIHTVNYNNNFNLHKALTALQIINKAWKENGEISEEMLTSAIENVVGVSRLLGYQVNEDIVEQAMNEKSLTKMTVALGYMVRKLDNEVKVQEDLQRQGKIGEYSDMFAYDNTGSIRGDLTNFLEPITEVLEDSSISAFYDSGKMYQSYVTPSFLTKLMNKFHMADAEKFKEFIEDEYGFSEWYKDKNGWRNEWLEELASDPETRKIFEHKVELNFNKHNYMRNMSDAEYTLSLLTEYFSVKKGNNATKVPAWFRMPMQSNKPSSEYIKFWSYRGDDYKENIVYGMLKMFNQELSRINTVMRRNPKGAEKRADFIKNFDTNGRKFNYLPFLNPYLENTAEAKAKRTLFESADKNNEFAKLLQEKLNSKDLKDAEGTLKTLAEEAIFNHMQKRANSILDAWEKSGILAAAKKVEGIGKSKEAIRASVENFLWNDNYAAKNILQLTIGDIAFYKDAEDLQKRLAQLHAPGTRANIAATDYKGNRVSDGTYRTFILKDFDSFRSNIIANIEEVFDRKITAARPEDRPQLEALKDSLVRKPGTNGEDDKGGAYYKINVADAQGFCSPSSYRKKAFLFGKWSKKAENIYEKLLAGEVNYTDLETAFQPLKPFVYSKLKKDMGVEGAPITKMPVPFQAKNAEYLLIMADAIIKNEVNKSGELSRPNLLRAVYRVMEESEQLHPREGIDTVQFESAIKSGLQGAIDISVFAEMEGGEESAYKYMSDKIYKKRYFRNKQTGEVGTQYDYKVNETVHEASYEDYCLQQEVPPHFQNHSQAHGSQVRMIIPSDLDLYVDDTLKGAALTDPSNRIYYEITEPDGTVKKLTAEQFRKEYEDTISEGIEESLEELNDELLLYKKEINPETGKLVTVKNSNRRERNIALSKILQREILSSPRYGVDLIQACSIDRRTGEFRIPKGDPIQAKRIEQLINSIIKNRVNKQKIAGGPIVQVSNFGTSKQLQIRFKDKQGNLLMSRSEFATKNKNLSEEELNTKYKEFIKKNQGGIAYFEVFAPIWSKDLFHKFADVNGNIDIKAIEMVAPELLEMVSYRIPTEDKYSCAPMRVVGFMPKEAGDAIMLPWELTEIDDSDFDVDKRYVMRKEIDIYTRFEPKENQTMIEAEKEYIKHNREGIYKYLRKHVAPRITEEDKKMLAKIEKQVKSEFDIDRRTQEKEHERRLDEITKVSSLIDESNNRANEKRQISDKQWEKRDDKEESRYQRQVDKENERFKLQMDLIDSREQSEINKRYNTWLGNSFNERLDDFLTYTKFFSSEQDDAMTREIREAYMKYMYKAIKPTKYTNAKAYRNNKIIDMSLAVLTHERTADKILNPGGFEAPKRVGYMVAAYRNPANNLSWKELQNIKDTDELKKLCYADKDLTWADTQVQFYKQNSAAASLIGVFAVNKVAHATLESDGIWLAVDEICGDKSFTIGDTTFGGMMEIDKKFDSKGTLIGKTLGSLVSASADAVKDPILNLMNINMTTAGMLNTMLRLGMPFEEAALFLSQDVVGRLLDRFNRENLTNYVSLSSIIEKMLKEASTIKDAEGNDIDLGFSNDSKITDAPITKEDMIKGLTADSHKDIDYKVLLAFEKIRGLTDAMRKPTFATRFNSISSAVGPLIVDNLILERKMNSFTYDGKNSTHFYKSKGDRTSPAWVTENMVTIDTIHEKHPILKSFAKTVEYARDMFEDMPAGSEGFRNFLATIPGDTLDKIFGDKKLFSQLSDFYQSFMLIASGVVDQKHLKTSIEGFPTYFVKGGFKEKYPDNALIQAITLSKGKNAKYPVLQIQLTGLDEAQKEVYRNAWIDIHKDNPTLSRRLFEYCFFRAGIGFSPKTFMALVPTYVKERLETDLGNGRKTSYVKTYEKLSTENMSAEVIYDQFIRNNWNENKLVPKKKGDSFRFNTEKIRNEITGRIEDIDALYITSKEDVSDVEGNMYIKVKKGKEYQLWKFDRRQGDKLIYHRTSPLGNNGEYLEINTSNIISPMNVTTALKENSEETGMPDISAAESDANDTAKKKLISEAETAKRIERAVEKYMSGEADDYLTNGVPTLFEEHFSMMRSIMDNRLTEQGIEIDKDKFMDEYNKYC